MLITAIVLLAVAIAIAIGVLIFLITRPGGLIFPSQRYHAVIGLSVAGMLAIVALAFFIAYIFTGA